MRGTRSGKDGVTGNSKRDGRTDIQQQLRSIADLDIPEDLGEAGRALWENVAHAAPWVAETDVSMLILACELADLRRLTRAAITRADGDVSGTVLRAAGDQDARYLRALAELGLTPAARTAQGVGVVKIAGKLDSFRRAKDDHLDILHDDEDE
jgi:hypothetical protein